jgi:hypothetical protein
MQDLLGCFFFSLFKNGAGVDKTKNNSGAIPFFSGASIFFFANTG